MLISITLRCPSDRLAEARVDTTIIAEEPNSAIGQLGGLPVASNGTLERALLNAIAQAVTTLAPVASPGAGTPAP